MLRSQTLTTPGSRSTARSRRPTQTRRLGQFVVEGEKLVARLLASRFPAVSVLVTDRHLSRGWAVQVPADVPTYVVPDVLIDSIVGFPFHRGVLGCGERRAWPALDEIVERAGARLTLVICPRLSNPENLGAIARISDVFGIDAILAGPSCPDPLSRRVLRVSMGSSLRVPVIVSDRLEEIADNLARRDRVVLLGAVADPAAEPFDAVRRPDRLGLVLGEEDQGIEPEWLEKCARRGHHSHAPGSRVAKRRRGGGHLAPCFHATLTNKPARAMIGGGRREDARSFVAQSGCDSAVGGRSLPTRSSIRVRIKCILSSTERTVRPIVAAISALVKPWSFQRTILRRSSERPWSSRSISSSTTTFSSALG